MRIAITGAAGFLGQKLVARLCESGRLPTASTAETGADPAIAELALFDLCEPPEPEGAPFRVRTQAGDIADPAALTALLADGADVVYHLAAVVSSAAEADFDLGLRVNLDGTRALLEVCRQLPGPAPQLIFASSVAVYGGDLPEAVRDDTALAPQSSYGTQKAVCELLVNDYSRRGFIDGRVLRLPTIVVRPGRPNQAASSFASSIIREPLQGETAALPVPEDTALFVLSPRRVLDALCHAAAVPAEAFGACRSVMLPGVSVTVAEMIRALARVGGEEAVARIEQRPDPRIAAIVGGWPARFDTRKAARLGFTGDADMDAIVQAFVEDDMVPQAGH